MSPVRWIALGAVLVALPAACGFPTFGYAPSSGGSAAGGSASSSSSSSSSSTGGPVTCRLMHDTEDCGPEQRCTIVDELTGMASCVPIGVPTKSPYDACEDDVACPPGTWCDRRTLTCAPFCQTAADCGKGACAGARGTGGAVVPGGASVCTAYCDPASPTSCGVGAACNYDNNLAEFDCVYSLDLPAGAACGFGDCAPTFVCTSICVRWCHPIDVASPDCGGGMCEHFSNLTPSYEGSAYGFCAP